jgi:ADP-ribosylglycohydrolase
MCDATVLEVREKWPKNTIRCNIYAPQSLIAFLQSEDYESCVRNAVFMKGDTDTTAAIAGSIAEAFYGTKAIPQYMIDMAKRRMSPDMISVTNAFYKKLSQFEVDSPYKEFRL